MFEQVFTEIMSDQWYAGAIKEEDFDEGNNMSKVIERLKEALKKDGWIEPQK